MLFRVDAGLRDSMDEGRVPLLTAKGSSGATAGLAKDLQVLTKLRLNTFVVITTFFGFYLAARGLGGISGSWMLLVHTLIGTAASAFGSAAFNQLMEIEDDARMKRTSDRPLPSRRLSVMKAFGIGWGLSGYCPGPAMVSLLYGYESTIVFCVAMFAGMALEGPINRLFASS